MTCNKFSKWLRYAMRTLLIIIPVGALVCMAFNEYQKRYGRDYYDYRLSAEVDVHTYVDGSERLYNNITGEYTTPKFSWIVSPEDDHYLAVYALPNKRGYIDIHSGRVVIDAKENDYTRAWVFSEGLAAVAKGTKIGFINEQNEVVIPFQFSFPDDYDMYDHGYLFHGGYCAMTDADGKYGLIDRSGKWVVEPKYSDVWAPHYTGYRIVLDEDHNYGVLGPEGQEVFPTEYFYIDILDDGFQLAKEGRMWREDFAGRVTHPFVYSQSYYLKHPESCDEYGDNIVELSRYMEYWVIGKCGIFDRITGEVITPAIYEDVEMISETLFEVRLEDNYDYAIIDTDGNIVER